MVLFISRQNNIRFCTSSRLNSHSPRGAFSPALLEGAAAVAAAVARRGDDAIENDISNRFTVAMVIVQSDVYPFLCIFVCELKFSSGQ